MAEQDDPIESLRGLAGSFRRIKLGAGVVGKTSYVTGGLFAAWIVILCRLSESVVLNSCLLGGGLVLTISYFWWVNKTHKFAENNPSLAMLEGAQFVEYKKWEAEIKGLPKLTPNVISNPTKDSEAIDGDRKGG